MDEDLFDADDSCLYIDEMPGKGGRLLSLLKDVSELMRRHITQRPSRDSLIMDIYA